MVVEGCVLGVGGWVSARLTSGFTPFLFIVFMLLIVVLFLLVVLDAPGLYFSQSAYLGCCGVSMVP